jgi:hypothetical protein
VTSPNAAKAAPGKSPFEDVCDLFPQKLAACGVEKPIADRLVALVRSRRDVTERDLLLIVGMEGS